MSSATTGSGALAPSAGFLRRLVFRGTRTSLASRLLWTFLPIAVLPAVLYWVFAERHFARSEAELTVLLVKDATRLEKVRLGQAADARHDDFVEQVARVRSVLAEATADAVRALEAGPDPALPAERLVDAAGGPLRTAGNDVSAAMVSRAAPDPAAARRDLAATRRLERTFAALLVGYRFITSCSVMTATGTFRTVPPGDLTRLTRAGSFGPDFRLSSSFGGDLLRRLRDGEAAPVLWTRPYEDVYSGHGLLVTALGLARGRRGRILGMIGVDWKFPAFFARTPEPLKTGEAEMLLAAGGTPILIEPQKGLPGEVLPAVEEAAARPLVSDVEVATPSGAYLLAVRALPEPPSTYVRLRSVAAVENGVVSEVEPLFASGRRTRRDLRIGYGAGLLVLSALLVAATRRSVEPIRQVARFADAIAGGRPAPALGEAGALDEVGRLFRAMRNLDHRIQRRTRSMDATHRLAQAASAMTRPEETFARVSREIAEMVGATKAWFAVFEPGTRSLVLTPPGHGIPDEALGGRHVPLSDSSLLVHCYRTGETYIQNDVPPDPGAAGDLFASLRIDRNVAVVPLRTEVGILGVLGVADKPEGFDEEDRAAIEGIADQAALLLRNARLYDELQKSYERLREAQRNRDYFLQNINHELRTPLTAILGWSEILAEDRPDPETIRTALEQIGRSARFLLALISDLLDLSRFEEGRTRLEPEDVDLAPLVREAVEPVSLMAEGKGVVVCVEAPPPGTARARLDPMRTRQVIWNLVHNAVKFTPRGGRITVRASASREGARFEVADNGVGIDPKDLPFIFERFRQADGSTTRAYRGMGIGLALVKAYVELHGGTIRVDSLPGRGTSFTVLIPPAPTS